MIRCSRALLACCLGMTMLGAAVPRAAGQETPAVPFGQGTHALRALLKHKLNISPLTKSEFESRFQAVELNDVLLVVLGDARYLDELGKRRLEYLVRHGGAVFVATDQRTGPALTAAFGAEVQGDFLRV